MSGKKIPPGNLLMIGLLVVAVLLSAAAYLISRPAPADGITADRSRRGAGVLNERCLGCHEATPGDIARGVPQKIDSQRLRDSVHGALACASCHRDPALDDPHGGEAVSPATTRAQAGEQCGVCHQQESAQMKASIHALPGEQADSPTRPSCAGCHGSHYVQRPTAPTSAVTGVRGVETCGRCHEQALEAYRESFHGRAVFLGSRRTAQCISCHGAHEILAATAAASPVAPGNVPRTCGGCHLKAQPNFARRTEHAAIAPRGPGLPLYWTMKFFTWLTILTLVALIGHIELELAARLKRTKTAERGAPDVRTGA